MLYPCLLVVALAAVTVSAGPNAAGIAFLKENAEKEGVGTVIPFVVLFFGISSDPCLFFLSLASLGCTVQGA
jgi:hypothetical protein